jgi:hypothetical protein
MLSRESRADGVKMSMLLTALKLLVYTNAWPDVIYVTLEAPGGKDGIAMFTGPTVSLNSSWRVSCVRYQLNANRLFTSTMLICATSFWRTPTRTMFDVVKLMLLVLPRLLVVDRYVVMLDALDEKFVRMFEKEKA